ncbi:MAG: DUF4387 domain-containing protein [Peptococcaceae bacterium]|jgi:hypothetical protein|nr:DUF4387 domain-containing protein [Peptococcaceae bacterium]
MVKVQDIAKYVRSKNAGPFWTTLEIFCDNEGAYQKMKNSPNLTKEKVAPLYNANPAKMKRFDMDSLQVIK